MLEEYLDKTHSYNGNFFTFFKIFVIPIVSSVISAVIIGGLASYVTVKTVLARQEEKLLNVSTSLQRVSDRVDAFQAASGAGHSRRDAQIKSLMDAVGAMQASWLRPKDIERLQKDIDALSLDIRQLRDRLRAVEISKAR